MEDASSASRISARGGHKALLVIVLLVAGLLIAAGAWMFWFWASPRFGTYQHSYDITITANSTVGYILRLPVPRDINLNLPPGFESELEFDEGIQTTAIESTEHGDALCISGQGPANLSWHKTLSSSSSTRYGNLTMTYGAEGWSSGSSDDSPTAWIYCSTDGIIVSLFYRCENHHMETPWFASGGGPHFSLYSYTATEGWQEPVIDYGWILIN